MPNFISLRRKKKSPQNRLIKAQKCMGEYSREFYSSRWQELLRIVRAVGRPVQLVCVSKNQDEEKIRILYSLGIRDFGENKVQELVTKSKNLDFPDLRWHFIGHLQSNKVRTLLKIPRLKSIHSIDSLKLLKVLIANAGECKAPEIDLYLQANISKESEKGGFPDYAQLREAIVFLQSHAVTGPLRLAGLMGMGPIRTDQFERDSRKAFQTLSDMRGAVKEDYGLSLKLSMGMSDDFQIALECGSDVLRIGSYLFRVQT